VYLFLADTILLLHSSFVVFVVVGLALILLGGWLGWNWVRNPWFRIAHLVSIGIVVAQAWLGVICPLTILEMYFRKKAGDNTYSGSFIAYWLDKLLYYEAPFWVFVVVYTVFGFIVVMSWLWVRPNKLHQQH